MSYQGDDRKERESVNAPSITRNPSTDKDKTAIEKTKVTAGQTAAPTNESQQPQRQGMESQNIKTSKPLLNRPIAPAAVSNVVSMGTPIGAGYMPQAMTGYGHHMIAGYQMMRGPMGPMGPQQHYPHVPFGAASAAISASAHPKGISQMRGTALSTASKLPGMPSHIQGQGTALQSQTHASASGATSLSRPSSPSVAAQTSSSGAFHQQSVEYKQSELRDGRSQLIPDHTRRTGSPHCSSPSIQNSGAITTSAKTGIPSVVSQHKPGQAIMLPHFNQGHNPLSVATYPQPVLSVSNSIQQAVSGTSVSMSMSQHQAKPIQSVPVSIASMSKMYPSHMSIVPGRPGMGQSEGPASPDISRLSGKQSGPASPINIQQHSGTSTVPSSAHAIQASSIMDGRMERPHQGVPLPNQMLSNQMYPRYQFLSPETQGGYQIPFPHSGFSQPMQSGLRPPHTVTTPAMPGMHILDQNFFAAAAAANNALRLNLSAGNMPSDGLASVALMDSGGTGQGVWNGMQIGMQPSSSLQIPITSSNPNATSPRPSILRKRTSEGLRKPAVIPFNDWPSSVANEPLPSPRSDTTLSAPQSGQSSPKPPSDSGAQASEQPQPSTVTPVATSVPPVEPAAISQSAPASPVKVKKDPSELATSTAVCASVTASTAMVTTSSSTLEKPAAVAVALPDGASPRKKPRKQNVVVTEDKYGSSVPLEDASSDEEEKKVKPQIEDTTIMDDDLKFILLKRPKISIFGGYKVNTKAAHNHFLRYSDVRIKEERKPTLQDIANQKGILHRVSGWRVHHVAAQMDDLSSLEQDVLQKLFEFRENLPKPRPGLKSKYHDELMMLDELVQGNIQRSQLVAEQLADIRKVMVKVLDHRPRCMEILQRYTNKRNQKKKS